MTRRDSLPLTDTTALAEAADEDGSAPLYAVRTDGCRVIAGAGASLSAAAGAAYRNGLGGLAFAAGIPGSVGGGLVMNAGAYGGEMKQVVIRDTPDEYRIIDVQDWIDNDESLDGVYGY